MLKLVTNCSFKGVRFYFPYRSFESQVLRPNLCRLTFSLKFVVYVEKPTQRENDV